MAALAAGTSEAVGAVGAVGAVNTITAIDQTVQRRLSRVFTAEIFDTALIAVIICDPVFCGHFKFSLCLQRGQTTCVVV